MKTRSILMTTLCSLMLGIGFAGCSDSEFDDYENEFGKNPEEEAQHRGIYVLNEGLWRANNANISGFVYNVNSNEINALGDLYKKENLVQMGDVANGMVEEDNIGAGFRPGQQQDGGRQGPRPARGRQNSRHWQGEGLAIY